jgi:lysyl-tRNA synthetase, class II
MNSKNTISTSSIDTQRKLRIEKIFKLRELGIEPYPVNSKRDYTLIDIKNNFDEIKKIDQEVYLCGRVKTKRGGGKIIFLNLEDESNPSGFQVVIKIDEIPENRDLLLQSKLEKDSLSFQEVKSLIDEGDYVQVKGYLDQTMTGENSLFVREIKILSKCLRPLPEKIDYDNTESRYLDRVADLKFNTSDENALSIRDIVKLRGIYWNIWREEMTKEGFLEFQNNTFETHPAGADAKPFLTNYNELNQEVNLRIALELPLKKLIAGGYEKVYEIGRIFRNEGSSPSHLQEYSQIEWYWAYSNYFDAMPFTIRIYRRIVNAIVGSLVHTGYNGDEINWGPWCSEEMGKVNGWKLVDGWPLIPYFDAIRYYSKNYYKNGEIDLENKSYDELLQIASNQEIVIEKGTAYGNLVDKIYKKVARPFMINPFFLIDQPIEVEPLAKRSPENPNRVHRWQILAGGAELGKCFSELNDPLDQYDRLKAQQDAKDNGDEEAQSLDEEYVKAMEYGMPPMSGFGMSERLVSFLLGKHIKEVTTFPYIRDKNEEINKKTKVFHVILNSDKSIPSWQRLNAIAHLTGSVIAHNLRKTDVIEIETVKTKDGLEFPMDLRWGIHIKQSGDSQKILDIYKQAKENVELKTTLFGEDFFVAKDGKQAIDMFLNKNQDEIKWIGVLIYGDIKKVRRLTDELEDFDS